MSAVSGPPPYPARDCAPFVVSSLGAALGNLELGEKALHLWQRGGIMKRTFFVLSILSMAVVLAGFMALAAPAQTPPAPVISPDVHADRSVTFRLRAPNDKEV